MTLRAVGGMVMLLGIGFALHAIADSTGVATPDSAAVRLDSAMVRPDSVAVRRVSRGNAVLGKKIFAVKCVACHRADGSGGIKVTVTPTPDWRDAKRMSDPRHGDALARQQATWRDLDLLADWRPEHAPELRGKHGARDARTPTSGSASSRNGCRPW